MPSSPSDKPAQEAPQTSRPVARGPDGRVRAGGGSLNPGGQPKWLRLLKKGLAAGSQDAMKMVLDALKDEAKDFTIYEGLVVEHKAHFRDRVKVLELWFSHMVPKPKEGETPADTGRAMNGWTKEDLLDLARAKPKPH